jgi:2-keto-4-pentenoate hydratase
MSRVHELADGLERAHRERKSVALPHDLTRDEAYRLQDLVFAALAPGERPRAWKVGAPSPDVEPTMAQILPGRLYASPATVAAHGFQIIAVETEIAFRLGGDGNPLEALAAIEVCDTRLADWDSASPAAKLADFQSNAALVTGSGTPCWRDVDFRMQRAQLWIEGRLAKDVTGAHPYGSPAGLLPWARAHAANRGGLRGGDILTTGSWTGMDFVQPGAEVRVVFPGIGEAVVKLKGGT